VQKRLLQTHQQSHRPPVDRSTQLVFESADHRREPRIVVCRKHSSSPSMAELQSWQAPVRWMLTAHDVRKQTGITSICGTSDVVKVSTVSYSCTAVFKSEYFTPEYLLRVKYYHSNIFCLKIPGTENPENPRAQRPYQCWDACCPQMAIN
jgi:hypothetical protein